MVTDSWPNTVGTAVESEVTSESSDLTRVGRITETDADSGLLTVESEVPKMVTVVVRVD